MTNNWEKTKREFRKLYGNDFEGGFREKIENFLKAKQLELIKDVIKIVEDADVECCRECSGGWCTKYDIEDKLKEYAKMFQM